MKLQPYEIAQLDQAEAARRVAIGEAIDELVDAVRDHHPYCPTPEICCGAEAHLVLTSCPPRVVRDVALEALRRLATTKTSEAEPVPRTRLITKARMFLYGLVGGWR